jgi:hypothetical protein
VVVYYLLVVDSTYLPLCQPAGDGDGDDEVDGGGGGDVHRSGSRRVSVTRNPDIDRTVHNTF